MAEITTAFNDAFRDFVTDGIPSSGSNKPSKPEIRAIGPLIEEQLDAVAELAVSGIKWLPASVGAIRVRATGNVSIATLINGVVVNGVTLATGEHVFLPYQTTPSQNGLYTVAASVTGVRSTFADAAAELAYIGFPIQGGTVGAGERWTLPLAASAIVVGTTALQFALEGYEPGNSAEVTAARQGLDSLNFSIDAIRNMAFTEFGDGVFDPMTPVYRSGRIGVEAAAFSNAIGHAMPFDWDGTRFDYVKIWVRPYAAPNAMMRVGIWSADKLTLYASGYVLAMRSASPAHIWVKLDRPITTTLTAAGVKYLSVDGIKSETTLKGRIAVYEVHDRVSPNLGTYPLLYTPYTTPSTSLSAWSTWTDSGRTGLTFELYNSEGTAKRGMAKADPRADEIVMTPRLCGIVGTEMNVYLASLVAGRKEKGYHLTGIAAPARQLRERWTMTPTAAIAAGTLTIKILDQDDYSPLDTRTVTVDIVAENAAAAAPRVICAIGDSLTASGQWIQRMLDKSTASANSVKPTFQGTKGSGLVKHEGVGGRRLTHVYQPQTTGLAADNPFVSGINQYFDATYYMSTNPTFVVPAIVIWHLGINESIVQTSETIMLSVARLYCDQLAEMIGVKASANPVVPWSTVSASIKHIVAVPAATGGQDGFGIPTYAGLNYQEGILHRYCHILRNRIIKVFGGSEASGIFLMPWHVTNDPANSYEFVNQAWNVNTARTTDRAQDAIHPIATGLGGYQQFGDSGHAWLNTGVVRGWF
jgi:hypothetical protein